MFFLVSGAAASGKSTLAQNLSKEVDSFICHDADERIVTDVHMRCQQLEEWVQLALEYQAKGKDFLLITHSPLGELLACPSAISLTGISAALLDCHDTARIQRMRDRGFDPDWPPSQHVLNWASWHRMHAWDPQWEQEVIVGNGGDTHQYGRWLDWPQFDSRWQVHVIDTTLINIDMVKESITTWVHQVSKRHISLNLDTKWGI